jgi:hypothetical protein
MAHQGSVTGAYGRDYKNESAAQKDWYEGKDFQYWNISSPYDGKYCSCRDFSVDDSLQLRFNKKSDLVIVNGTKMEKVK